MAVRWLSVVVHTASIFRIVIVVDSLSSILFRQQLFDFPSIRLHANGEFQIFFSDRIPELVDHHHCKQVAKSGKENSI